MGLTAAFGRFTSIPSVAGVCPCRTGIATVRNPSTILAKRWFMMSFRVGKSVARRVRLVSLAVLAGAQMLAEKRQYVVLKTVGHRAGVRPLIDLERVGNAVAVQNLVQLLRAGAQAVLVAHIDR